MDDCSKFGMQKVVVPTEDDKWVQFKSFRKMLPVPLVIYANFKVYLSKLQSLRTRTLRCIDTNSTSCPALRAWSSVQRSFQPVAYPGLNVVEELQTRLKQEVRAIQDVLSCFGTGLYSYLNLISYTVFVFSKVFKI